MSCNIELIQKIKEKKIRIEILPPFGCVSFIKCLIDSCPPMSLQVASCKTHRTVKKIRRVEDITQLCHSQMTCSTSIHEQDDIKLGKRSTEADKQYYTSSLVHYYYNLQAFKEQQLASSKHNIQQLNGRSNLNKTGQEVEERVRVQGLERVTCRQEKRLLPSGVGVWWPVGSKRRRRRRRRIQTAAASFQEVAASIQKRLGPGSPSLLCGELRVIPAKIGFRFGPWLFLGWAVSRPCHVRVPPCSWVFF
uniref:Uncharacterized protein n=1 Tax=Triticum urartu TaxID=4572 RepID=A0A8R7TGJ8_TRIUA